MSYDRSMEQKLVDELETFHIELEPEDVELVDYINEKATNYARTDNFIIQFTHRLKENGLMIDYIRPSTYDLSHFPSLPEGSVTVGRINEFAECHDLFYHLMFVEVDGGREVVKGMEVRSPGEDDELKNDYLMLNTE